LSKTIILIAGPTASGKSNLAVQLAKKINGEIINADSMQIYKEFSTLSSRPSKTDLKKIKHHLYGITSVKKYFSVGHWLKLTKVQIKKCTKDKKIPILVGGTGLYFNAVTNGISKVPSIKSNIRLKLRNLHEKIGQKKFYEKLIRIDPLARKKILLSDTQRTIRAYEVKIATGKSLYEWSVNTKSDFLDYKIKNFYLDIPRDVLLKNIYARTEVMFRNNCVNEVQKFLKLGIASSLSANKMIGVEEIANYLKKLSTLERTKELINIKTRQYAKRQNTWSRGHMKNWSRVYSKNLTILSKKILKVIS
jgi:tRNA dimethylallyltransferase